MVPVFVLDPRLLDGRFPSPNRAWFLHGCLAELRDALRERGADLVIREGRPERELPALAREAGAGALYLASDVSPFATARDRRVEEALGDAVEVRRTPGNFVADIGAVRPYRSSRRSTARGASSSGARSTARRGRSRSRPGSGSAACPRRRSPRPPSRPGPASARRASAPRRGSPAG